MKTMLSKLLIAVAACALSVVNAYAEVSVPKCFTDNGVFQRDKPICVWGWADPDEQVTVTFGDVSATTNACERGAWKVQLPALPASYEPKDLTIKGTNELKFTNILVGEVWICSGQSNMEMPLNSWGQKKRGSEDPRLACTPEELNGDYSYIRFNRPNHVITDEPQKDFATPGWLVCKDGVQKDCTAAGFHFAVRLHNELDVPVGLIDSNWGGSNINSWIPDAGWNQVPETVQVGIDLIAKRPTEQNAFFKAGGMYNAMLAPWINYNFRGAIWYQGCSNAGEREFYYYKQKAMIREWRKVFKNGDFPFYWVQLAPFTAIKDDPNDTGDWPYLRNGQTICLEVPNSGQAVIIDAGETDDIHPTNKYIVGNRLALWALAQIFNKDVECCSPLVKSADFDGGKVTLTFEHVGGGLVSGVLNEREFAKTDAKLKCFAIAGSDGKYVWANAEIVAPNQVVVSADGIDAATGVRYAFQMYPDGCNLYSAEGLPATPFEVKK